MVSPPPKRAALIIAIALTGVLLAGCGSSYTNADFIRRADGICLSTTRAVRLLKPPEFSGTPAQQRASVAAYLSKVGPLVQSEARRLAGLPKPPTNRNRDRLRASWLTVVHDSGQLLGRLGSGMRHGDQTTVIAIERLLTELPVTRLAKQYGARGCAGPAASYSYSPPG